MLSCRRYGESLVLYLHGELAGKARRQLEHHLDRCSLCRETLEEFRAVIRLAAQRDMPAPSAMTIDLIHQAAKAGIPDSGPGAVGVQRRQRWHGARVVAVTAVSSVILLAAVALLVGLVVRHPSETTYEPPQFVYEPPAASWTDEEGAQDVLVSEAGRDGFTEALGAPSDVEARLAKLEADTLYMNQQMAREMMPVFDRRVHGLENAVFTLALDLERE